MSTYTNSSANTANAIRNSLSDEKCRLVFVSGNFNIAHPGHIRLLNFAAECGDCLVVGVNPNNPLTTFIDQLDRLEAVASIGVVNHAVAINTSVSEFISELKPDVVVKGKEHENKVNSEESILRDYGGRLIFSSGESFFSSIDLLSREIGRRDSNSLLQPVDYMQRHKIDKNNIRKIIRAFDGMRIVVIGDLILDEYITCDPIGMSQEDPTIVVTPIHTDLFVGGAGIVASHAAGLGGEINFLSVTGDDDARKSAIEKLSDFNVKAFLLTDDSRPTTLKKRYRARNKTLLRVSHLRQHSLDSQLLSELFEAFSTAVKAADLVIFSDFNYGCLPTIFVEKAVNYCEQLNIAMVADSQTSSQFGDIIRFKNMLLITPTEHESRVALSDSSSGLAVLAHKLNLLASPKNVIITLGAEGVFIQSNSGGKGVVAVDQLPALNMSPKDVSGAGDCLLTAASMSLVAGSSLWEAAYVGSLAAACQVGRVGNLPLNTAELIEGLGP